MPGTRNCKMDFFTKLAETDSSAQEHIAAAMPARPAADSCTDPIARKYDVRNISSRSLIQMSQELLQADRIDREIFAMLSFQPELSNAYDQVGANGIKRPDPDQPRDAIEEWKNILDTQINFNKYSYFTGKTRDVIYILEQLDKARRGIRGGGNAGGGWGVLNGTGTR